MADRIHTLIIELDDQGQTLTFRHWLPEEDQTVYRRASYRPFDTSIRELADNILDILAQHAGRPSAESLAREQLQHAGSKLYRKVFSGEVADALQKESGNSYLLLNLSLDVLGIPWELLHDGEQFLCQRFKVGRHLEKTHDELTAAKIRVEGKRTGGSLIVFGDTSGLQPGDEKNVVKKLLERVFYVPFCGSLTAMDLFEELQHDYAIVHYIGHGEYHEGDRTRTGWRCTDGSLLSCSDIEDMPSRATFPLLIFANACDSARSSLPPSPVATFEKYVSDLYLAFLRRGVPHYIGTLAPIPDEYSQEFAGVFYQNLVTEATVGEALLRAREEFLQKPGFPIWAYYVHYGDPRHSLVPTERSREAAKKQPTRSSRLPGSSTETRPPAVPQVEVCIKDLKNHPLTVATIDDVLCWGWDGYQLMEELIRLDYETMEGLTVEHEGRPNQWAPVIMDHPDTWRLIIDEPGSVVGNWHFVPLFEEEFELAKQGRLYDSHLTTDKVRLFELPGEYDIYFLAIFIRQRFRRTRALHLLFRSLLDVFTELAHEGIFIREICANAYTPSGAGLCKSFGMRYLRDHESRGQIFVREFYPFPRLDIFNEHPVLTGLYAQRFRKGS